MPIFGNSPKFKSRRGITMIELLVVVSIIALLIILLVLLLTRQLSRGRDAERKADLERIKIAFEDYYNDNGCYPDSDILENCNSDDLDPYLKMIPCDPISGNPYYYVPLEGDQCSGYRVYTSLEDLDDPVISALGCNTSNGCGFGSEYNYGISAGIPVTGSPGGGSAPVNIYVYACDSAGTCNRFEEGHPDLLKCPTTFKTPGCEGVCSNPANWCE